MNVNQLKDQPAMTGNRPILFCPHCLGEFSANAGDYFYLDPQTEMTCECGGSFQLVTKEVRYVKVEVPEVPKIKTPQELLLDALHEAETIAREFYAVLPRGKGKISRRNRLNEQVHNLIAVECALKNIRRMALPAEEGGA